MNVSLFGLAFAAAAVSIGKIRAQSDLAALLCIYLVPYLTGALIGILSWIMGTLASDNFRFCVDYSLVGSIIYFGLSGLVSLLEASRTGVTVIANLMSADALSAIAYLNVPMKLAIGTFLGAALS